MTNILTVIDYFSKKVWARGMESGTSKETAEAFESILRESKTIPRVLHHDDLLSRDDRSIAADNSLATEV